MAKSKKRKLSKTLRTRRSARFATKLIPAVIAAAGLFAGASNANAVNISGLAVDYLRGDINESALVLPAGTGGYQSGVDNGQTDTSPPWAGATTYVYTGQIFDADGIFAFAENIDDKVRVKVDGVQVINSDNWNVATTSSSTTSNSAAGAGTIDFGMGANNDGWHDIEIRMSNGGGGAGANGSNTGWSSTFGFGFNDNPVVDGVVGSVDGNDYTAPVDPGDASLFRTQVSGIAAPGAAGMVQGILVGNINTAPNPNAVDLNQVVIDHVTDGPVLGYTNGKPPWQDNMTAVYSGFLFDADGIFSLAESIDDKVRIFVDGNLVLSNDAHNVATTTGILDLGAGSNGWFKLDIYMSNGGGGAGATGASAGWATNFGIGFNADGTTSLLAADYVALNTDNARLQIGLVPEPTSLALLSLGALVGTMRRRRRES